MDRSVYTRPNKPKFLPVTRRARDFAPDGGSPAPVEILAVDRATECHVTPAETADRMIDYLNLEDGLTAIDPEMGTGNLVNALLESGYELQITGNELNASLYGVCKKRFVDKKVTLLNECWLSGIDDNESIFYDRIISNPPFRHTKKHIEKSLQRLAPGGILVALVPVTFRHPDATELETLDRGIFALTQVYTKLIAFYR